MPQLTTESVEVAEDPGAQEPFVVRDEEGSTDVIKVTLGGRQAEQQAGVRAGVAQAGRSSLTLADQGDNLVLEVT